MNKIRLFSAIFRKNLHFFAIENCAFCDYWTKFAFNLRSFNETSILLWEWLVIFFSVTICGTLRYFCMDEFLKFPENSEQSHRWFKAKTEFHLNVGWSGKKYIANSRNCWRWIFTDILRFLTILNFNIQCRIYVNLQIIYRSCIK